MKPVRRMFDLDASLCSGRCCYSGPTLPEDHAMLRLHTSGPGLTRRELLRVGGLSLAGLTLSDLSALGATRKPRFRSCVFVFLSGGPSHIDLWDMKPEAPAEIRGEFAPVATSVPGIDLCEHLPRLAQQMRHLCLLRSMTHRM